MVCSDCGPRLCSADVSLVAMGYVVNRGGH